MHLPVVLFVMDAGLRGGPLRPPRPPAAAEPPAVNHARLPLGQTRPLPTGDRGIGARTPPRPLRIALTPVVLRAGKVAAIGYNALMSLLTLWQQSRDQLEGKRLDQLIAFAGDGKLMDGSTTSVELRELLAAAPSSSLIAWKDEALSDRYDGFGFVLQDLVNEVGNRLGFSVAPGLYRGRHGVEGHDGVWKA